MQRRPLPQGPVPFSRRPSPSVIWNFSKSSASGTGVLVGEPGFAAPTSRGPYMPGPRGQCCGMCALGLPTAGHGQVRPQRGLFPCQLGKVFSAVAPKGATLSSLDPSSSHRSPRLL